MASSATKSATRSDRQCLPSAIRPCDFDNTPTTIYAVDSTTFTTTLTHVKRDAADERSAAEIGESSSFSSLMSEKGMG